MKLLIFSLDVKNQTLRVHSGEGFSSSRLKQFENSKLSSNDEIKVFYVESRASLVPRVNLVTYRISS